MFADTQNVSVNGVGAQLPRVAFGDRKGTFENVAAGLRLTISHVLGKRVRRNVRIDFNKMIDDPLLEGVNRPVSMSAYTVLDVPTVGYTPTEVADNLEALAVFLSDENNRLKLVNGES